MKYKDIIGYSEPKKKLIKEKVKYIPTITEQLEKEFGKLLTEGKEMPSNSVKKIAKLTDRNNHTEARRLLSSWMGNDRLMSFYEAMETLNKVFRGYPKELSRLNQKMEKELYKHIKRTWLNYKDIIGAL